MTKINDERHTPGSQRHAICNWYRKAYERFAILVKKDRRESVRGLEVPDCPGGGGDKISTLN